MNKGKNKAFDEDRRFRLTVEELHDPSNALGSHRSVSKAQQLDRYHDVLSLPSLMPSGARELRRYMTSEYWVSYISKIKSQTRLYEYLAGNGRSTLNLHFGGWLVANALFNLLPEGLT